MTVVVDLFLGIPSPSVDQPRFYYPPLVSPYKSPSFISIADHEVLPIIRTQTMNTCKC
ncbi:hypothetical protein Syun_024935 [Stephania yunnanensis]|uniref:Uncharacterized protein n=1 Tax=Stephania yunnanensis TaxID=152371 RepID=A0AAP0HVS2_9MAGN